jgi:8-oxo-dGTP pyrophosphatase MutT (NUDIX family)
MGRKEDGVIMQLTQHSAGGVVYRRQGNHIDIAMIKDSYNRWTFPKGHVEAGETFEETAKREISEEIGIEETALSTRKELGEMDYWFTSNYASDIEASKEANITIGKDGVLIHKYVTYFLFETNNEVILAPQEKEVAAVEWVPLQEIDERNEYEDNRELIRKAKDYIATVV